jgi:hypothetical protein
VFVEDIACFAEAVFIRLFGGIDKLQAGVFDRQFTSDKVAIDFLQRYNVAGETNGFEIRFIRKDFSIRRFSC